MVVQKAKKRVVDSAPLNTPKSTTLLSSIRLHGSTVPMVFQGALNKKRFLEYLRDYLVPTLQEGDIVITDNLSSHKGNNVAELIHSTGVRLILFELPFQRLLLLFQLLMRLAGFVFLDTADIFINCYRRSLL